MQIHTRIYSNKKINKIRHILSKKTFCKSISKEKKARIGIVTLWKSVIPHFGMKEFFWRLFKSTCNIVDVSFHRAGCCLIGFITPLCMTANLKPITHRCNYKKISVVVKHFIIKWLLQNTPGLGRLVSTGSMYCYFVTI